MKYTEDYPHRPIPGKAGESVDILSRVPADTDIVLDVATCFSRDIAPSALEIPIGTIVRLNISFTSKMMGR